MSFEATEQFIIVEIHWNHSTGNAAYQIVAQKEDESWRTHSLGSRHWGQKLATADSHQKEERPTPHYSRGSRPVCGLLWPLIGGERSVGGV